jgi:hypothetical protein
MKLPRIFDKLATHARSIADFISALQTHSRFIRQQSGVHGGRPVVFLSLRHNKLRRYTYALVAALLREYDVRIKISFSFLGRLFDCEKLLLQTNGVRFTYRCPRAAAAILHDGNYGATRCPSVLINRDYFNRFNDRSSTVIHFPFPMHPDRYRQDHREENADLYGRIRILFVGNTDLQYYDDPSITGRFGMLSRAALTKLTKQTFGTAVSTPHSYGELQAATTANAAESRIVLVESGSIVPSNRFLSVLDHADFFLALPGTKIPHCHNCIEALSRGCIPILQYGRLFPRPLADGVDSLYYRTADEYLQTLNRALNMTRSEINAMSAAAKNYYTESLSHESFMREFNKGIGSHAQLELIINAERRSLFPAATAT